MSKKLTLRTEQVRTLTSDELASSAGGWVSYQSGASWTVQVIHDPAGYGKLGSVLRLPTSENEVSAELEHGLRERDNGASVLRGPILR